MRDRGGWRGGFGGSSKSGDLKPIERRGEQRRQRDKKETGRDTERRDRQARDSRRDRETAKNASQWAALLLQKTPRASRAAAAASLVFLLGSFRDSRTSGTAEGRISCSVLLHTKHPTTANPPTTNPKP